MRPPCESIKVKKTTPYVPKRQILPCVRVARESEMQRSRRRGQSQSPRYKDVKGEKCRDFAATLRPASSAQPTQPLPRASQWGTGWSRDRASAGGRFHMFQAPDGLREGRHWNSAGDDAAGHQPHPIQVNTSSSSESRIFKPSLEPLTVSPRCKTRGREAVCGPTE